MSTVTPTNNEKISSSALSGLIDAFGANPAFSALDARLRDVQAGTQIRLSGLTGSARAFVIDWLWRNHRSPQLILTDDREDAFALAQDLEQFPFANCVFLFPALGIRPFDFTAPTGEVCGRRIEALAALKSNARAIVVAPIEAALEPTLTPDSLNAQTASLKVGADFEFDQLAGILTNLGFRRVTNVEEIGDFALRGGVVDLFSPGWLAPVRVEFVGDTVETIRTFDVTDQRTRANLNQVSILPRREWKYDSENIEELLSGVSPIEEDSLRSRLVADPDSPGLEWMATLLGQQSARLLDHAPSSALIFLENPESLKVNSGEKRADSEKRHTRFIAEFPSLSSIPQFYSEFDTEISKSTTHVTVEFLPFRGVDEAVIDIDCKEPPPIGANMDTLAQTLSSYRVADITYMIAADNSGQAERIHELVHDNFPGEHPPVSVALFQGGFFCKPAGAALLTDHEIFKRQYRRRIRKRFKEGVALTSYTNLTPNDYVVHTEHGIAKYLRLETLLLDGRHRDCLLLEYADKDKLYVPIEEFNRVSKYAGKNASPSLTSLGGAAWDKLKLKAQKSVEELAERLVRLYAERIARPGFAFGPDTQWMRRLEASFPYEETEDQQTAIDSVKSDMERPSPMDRLICGDVGFGKTEVAVRAALKCVEAGKQVAILTPTTILAQQHFNTFKERLQEFPVRIDLMSRFRTRKQLIATEGSIASGNVDIVIGTHRLLNKNVKFKDLGLLVVDEEQRFGVKQKERLRELRTSVDTITLTATPIPRTLQMSLSGARDMTLITTSPRGRLPISTSVSEFGPEVIAQGILREIDRGGQVFFVHNRIQTIEAVQKYIHKVLPQVSILVGHGQMPERELEQVMIDFVNRRAQVLLCTAIIESGLDIPSVNTILIDRADRFGMAQLYQLRGRVGRSSEQAFCYLLAPPYRRMTDDARKRLKAIEAHTELGSGFALAMRDLEIRGAGNLLGAKQSGYIDEIGFDMYTKLLEEAVAQLKGEDLASQHETTIEVDVDAYLPEDYIDVNQLKVDFYRRLAGAKSLKQIDEITAELIDRFGQAPQPATHLVNVTAVKLLGSQLGIEKIRMRSGRVDLRYDISRQIQRADVERLRGAIDQPMEFTFSPQANIVVDLSGMPEARRLPYLRDALSQVWESQTNARPAGIA